MKPKKKPQRGGKPAFIFTPEMRTQIEAMAGFGMKQNDIAVVIGCGESTLQRRCAKELHAGAVKANARVINSLFQNAISGNVAAQIFWAKARCGWRDVQAVEHTGKDGEAIVIKLVRYEAK